MLCITHKRPAAIRLRVDVEAQALISDFGGEAYANRSAGGLTKTSSEMLAADWREVASTIARRTADCSAICGRFDGTPRRGARTSHGRRAFGKPGMLLVFR